MTVFVHELKRNRLSLIIWSAAISFMLAICVIIYPEMSTQMNEISDMFSDMGAFSSAFGMDQLNFGEFMGYFGVECGNTLGLGGALFAAMIGAAMLSKEEKDKTAEFLLTHPLSRSKIVAQKLFAALAQILILNLSVVAVTSLSILAIDVEANASRLALLFLAYFLLQVEIAMLTFCISAFVRGGGLGIGLGLALGLYFLNIMANLSEDIEFLKFLTPFGYADGGHIITEGAVEIKYLTLGMIFAVISVVVAFKKYTSKDIL